MTTDTKFGPAEKVGAGWRFTALARCDTFYTWHVTAITIEEAVALTEARQEEWFWKR